MKFINLKFVFLLLFLNKSFCNICGINSNPKNPNDCLNDTSDNINACCYLNVLLTNTTSNSTLTNQTACEVVPKNQTFLATYIDSFDLELNVDYAISVILNCGDISNNLYPPCGPYASSPANSSQCTNYSTTSKSCCYLSSPLNHSYCITNPTRTSDSLSLFGYNLICKGQYLKFDVLLFLIFILCIM
jgi:hypothetical protein